MITASDRGSQAALRLVTRRSYSLVAPLGPPANWSPGSGTIVTGAAANEAKAAAVAAYPGGSVNRVVMLSNGDYNVHIIGVNWPHHVFVNKDFKVIGAE